MHSRRRRIVRNNINNNNINNNNNFITEDDITAWVARNNGLIISRKINNTDDIDLKLVNFVCLCGCPKIINIFFNNFIDKLEKITLILIEADNINLNIQQIENSQIEKIFMWNKNINHEKIFCLPIGLNKARHVNLINREKNNIEKTKLLLLNCEASSHPGRNKLIKKAGTEWNIFCDFRETVKNEKVYSIKTNSESELQVFITSKEYYNMLEDYKFVLSPRGGGEDCHRTWEALYTGVIPIVKKSSIDELYENLPVLVVKDWDEINEDLLNKTWQEYKEKEFKMEKITLRYWVEKIIGKKIHFITYANNKFEKAKKRIISEANNFGTFKSVAGYGPKDLDREFTEKFNHILSQPRIGGYGIWRPYIIKKELEKLNNGDLLFYIDAGCTLNKQGKKRFNEYINLLNNSQYGIISFQMEDQREKCWTNKEIFNYFDVDIESDTGNSGQYLDGILLMKKGKHLEKIIDLWLKAVYDQPDMFTDKYNKEQNIFFKDNRHEQSVFSLIRKIYGSEIIVGDETFHPQPFGCEESLKYPIWAARKTD